MLSIIVPVYNAKEYLPICIKSVIKQTNAEWELILIDDGSTDGSAKICDFYAKKDCRISVVHQKNRGAAAARNAGIKLAKGEYITFVDADDWLEPVYIEIMMSFLLTYNTDIVCCGLKEYRNKAVINRQSGLKYEKEKLRDDDLEYIAKLVLTMHGEDGSSCLNLTGSVCKIYRKEIISDVEFPTDLRVGEDAAFFLQIIEKKISMSIIKEYLYNRRVHNSSVSYNKDDYVYTAMNQYVWWVWNNYVKVRCSNEELVEAFCKLEMNFYLWIITRSIGFFPPCHEDKVKVKKQLIKFRKSLPMPLDWGKTAESRFGICLVKHGQLYLYKLYKCFNAFIRFMKEWFK